MEWSLLLPAYSMPGNTDLLAEIHGNLAVLINLVRVCRMVRVP